MVDNDLEGSCGLKKVQHVQMQPMQQPNADQSCKRGTWDAARSFMTCVCVWIRKLKPSKLHVDHVVKPKDERDKLVAENKT